MPHKVSKSKPRGKQSRAKRPPYEVGYGRPPMDSRFEPGVSGNPRGRPKGSLNLDTVLTRVLRETVVINENGRKKTITKLEAAVMQLARSALNGDVGAIKHVLSLSTLAEERANIQQPAEKPLGRTEAKMLQNLMKRFDGSGKDNTNA